MLLALALLALLLAAGPTAAAPHKPHIVYFLVDDLGFSNVGYNNRPNPEPLTPHIDALHDGGAELTNYYVYRFCSPTRSSFISGRLPYHVNQENHPPASPGGGVPLEMTTIADKLNASGYLGHQIGKWHCGMSCTGHLPVHRGFRSSLGYLSGAEDHFADTRSAAGFAGVDFWRSFSPAYGENGSQPNGMDYNTYKFTAQALMIINAHPASSPLFLYLAYQNIHGPTQAPANYTALYDPEKIRFEPRLLCLAMIAAVDDSIGEIVQALKLKQLWENTLIIFSSDNGGPADHANNWPLRGAKGSDFEGGTRVCAFLNGGFLSPSLHGTKIPGMMHITDWWATLSTLTGQSVDDPRAAAANLPPPDSIDMWPMLSGANSTSPRVTLVLRAVPAAEGDIGQAGLIHTMKLPGAAVANRMKLVTGAQGGYWGGQYAPNNTKAVTQPGCAGGCLFNLDLDPTEHIDLADDPRYASTLALLHSMLAAATTTYYQSPGSEAADRKAVPVAKAHGGFWSPWLAGPYIPPPPAPPNPPLPPVPPERGFILRHNGTDAVAALAGSAFAPLCLTVVGLTKASHAIYGQCDGGSHWDVDPESSTLTGAIINVAAKGEGGYLRESPFSNCSIGNTAQLGIAGGAGDIVTVFQGGKLREMACGTAASSGGGLCLGVASNCLPNSDTCAIELVACDNPAASGWSKETFGHRADPFERFS